MIIWLQFYRRSIQKSYRGCQSDCRIWILLSSSQCYCIAISCQITYVVLLLNLLLKRSLIFWNNETLENMKMKIVHLVCLQNFSNCLTFLIPWYAHMISNLDLKNIFFSTNIVVHKTCFQDANAINKLYLVLYLGRKVNHELRF